MEHQEVAVPQLRNRALCKSSAAYQVNVGGARPQQSTASEMRVLEVMLNG